MPSGLAVIKHCSYSDGGLQTEFIWPFLIKYDNPLLFDTLCQYFIYEKMHLITLYVSTSQNTLIQLQFVDGRIIRITICIA